MMSPQTERMATKLVGEIPPEADPEFFVSFWRSFVLCRPQDRVFFMPMMHICIKVLKYRHDWKAIQARAFGYREYWDGVITGNTDFMCIGEVEFKC